MAESTPTADDDAVDNAAADPKADGRRVRFQGVVDALTGHSRPDDVEEQAGDDDAKAGAGKMGDASSEQADENSTAGGALAPHVGPQSGEQEPNAGVVPATIPAEQPEPNWLKHSRQVWWLSRAAAVFVATLMLTCWPVATAYGLWRTTGSLQGLNLFATYPMWALVFMFVCPAMLWLFGYMLSRQMVMMHAAEQIADAARQMTQPDRTAIFNIESVGAVVRTQVDAINTGIDDALIRLASVEAMIRDHVGAIEQAGEAIETRASGTLERVVMERTRLIGMTEQLNAHADSFAVAIAEKAQASIDRLANARVSADDAEQQLETRFKGLEAAAQVALQSFQSLAAALEDADERIATKAQSIESVTKDARRASEVATRVADEAAESAARNAVSIGQFARKAADEAKAAADAAIETARTETNRLAGEAIETAAASSESIKEATIKSVEDVRQSTERAVGSVAEDAQRALEAAAQASQAASQAGEAARLAAEGVVSAGVNAEELAAAALNQAEASAERAEKRNSELIDARTALEQENNRLESLIDEQRRRADRLADAIAAQTERLSKLAEAQLREQEAAVRLANAQPTTSSPSATPPDAAPTVEPLTEETATLAGTPDKDVDEQDEQEDENATRDATPPAEAADESRAPTPQPAAKTQERPATPPTPVADAFAGQGSNGAHQPAEETVARDQLRRRIDATRLDELAKSIERNGPRPAPAANARRSRKEGVTWREILTATDDAGPIDLSAKARQRRARESEALTAEQEAELNAVKVVHRLQNFTLNVERRLYGEPPPSLLERFDGGDRNIFANRLLRLNEADVKRRIRTEFGRDKAFERALHEFLHGFEGLLENATTSETADEELEQYLSSPLGRVYLLIGATVGYFA